MHRGRRRADLPPVTGRECERRAIRPPTFWLRVRVVSAGGRLTDRDLLPFAEVSDLHLGREDAAALEETGELQAGVAPRHAAQRGGGPGAEGGGERSRVSGTQEKLQ